MVSGALAKILFDMGATHSFIVYNFMLEIGLRPDYLWVPLTISTPVGMSVIFDSVS